MAIRERTIEELICDVCGREADGEYNSIAYLNGNKYSETSCPLDLCEEHMTLFVSECLHLEYERGDNDFEEKKIKALEVLMEHK